MNEIQGDFSSVSLLSSGRKENSSLLIAMVAICTVPFSWYFICVMQRYFVLTLYFPVTMWHYSAVFVNGYNCPV